VLNLGDPNRKLFGQRSRSGRNCRAAMGALVSALLVSGSALSAYANDVFTLKSGSLLGNFDLPLAELPAAVSPQALIGDPSTQDLYVLGLVGEDVAGTAPTPVAIRYGRRLGRSDARIVTGPAPLTIPVMLTSGVTLRGGVARSAGGGTLAIGLSSGPVLYFYDARTLTTQSIASFGTQLSLASGLSTALTKVTSVTGLGTKIYATDGVSPLVAQIDLVTGGVKSCPVDAPVLGLSADSGKVVATTSKGAATLTDVCTAAMSSTGSVANSAPSTLSATLPLRTFELSERVLEMTFPQFPAAVKARRGLVVSAVAGSPTSTISISAGTCLNTKFRS